MHIVDNVTLVVHLKICKLSQKLFVLESRLLIPVRIWISSVDAVKNKQIKEEIKLEEILQRKKERSTKSKKADLNLSLLMEEFMPREEQRLN